LTREYLKKHLRYDKTSGIFTWRHSKGAAFANSVAGSKDKSGYIIIRLDGRLYPAHRLAWLWEFGVFPKAFIDHKNQIKSDNRLNNLREASKQMNGRNRKSQKNNSSGIKGAYFDKNRRCWRAEIKVDGNAKKYLGSFKSKKDAALAYNAAAKLFFGEFAFLNNVR